MTPGLSTVTLTEREQWMLSSALLGVIERTAPDAGLIDEADWRVAHLDDEQRRRSVAECVTLISRLVPEGVDDDDE